MNTNEILKNAIVKAIKNIQDYFPDLVDDEDSIQYEIVKDLQDALNTAGDD